MKEQKLEKDSSHTESNCTYSIVDRADGRYLQINTYGTKTRQVPDTTSQTIRFTPEAIQQLKSLLKEHFK